MARVTELAPSLRSRRMAGTGQGRWWAVVAVGACCSFVSGLLLSVSCVASRFEGTPGSADYCTAGEERAFGALLFVGLTIGVAEVLLGGIVMARRRFRRRAQMTERG